MVVLEARVIRVNADKGGRCCQRNAAFLNQFLPQGVNGGLAAFNAAARQEPAFCIGVADHEDLAISVFDGGADTKCHRARQAKPALECAGA